MADIIGAFCGGLALGCVIALVAVQLVGNAYEKSIAAIIEGMIKEELERYGNLFRP